MNLSIVYNILIILCICFLILLLFISNKRNNKIKEELQKKLQEKSEQFQKDLNKYDENFKRQVYNQILNEKEKELVAFVSEECEKLEKIYEDKEQFYYDLALKRADEYELKKKMMDDFLKDKKDIIDKEIKDYKDEEHAQALLELKQAYEKEQKECEEKLIQFLTICEQKKNASLQEQESIQTELEDYKARRDVINEEIMRQREIEEKQDFYRVQLDEQSLHDLEILSKTKSQLTKIDLIDKLVYDNYINKPVQEMIKRVLGGEAPSGIYKITRLKTGEVYIGKSTDVKARFQQHAKTCYNCGTISHSMLHTTMQKDGIYNFTWELLEKVPKEHLGEREKYWINFYDSKKYGLNTKEGG